MHRYRENSIKADGNMYKEGVGCTNRIKRLSVGINDWILTEDLSTNK
jgi:hypothetical protein